MVDLKDVPSIGIGSNAIAALHKDVFYGRPGQCQANLVQRTKSRALEAMSKSKGLAIRLRPLGPLHVPELTQSEKMQALRV